MRAFGLATDERGYVELLAQAGVVEVDIRVGLERQDGDKGRCFGGAEGVMELDALFVQFQVGAVGQQRRDADAARDQHVLDGVLGGREVVRGCGDGQFIAALDFLVHVFRAALPFRRALHGDEVRQAFAVAAVDQRVAVAVDRPAVAHVDDDVAAGSEFREQGAAGVGEDEEFESWCSHPRSQRQLTVMIWRLSRPSSLSDMAASFSAVAISLTTLSCGALTALAGLRSRVTGN